MPGGSSGRANDPPTKPTLKKAAIAHRFIEITPVTQLFAVLAGALFSWLILSELLTRAADDMSSSIVAEREIKSVADVRTEMN
ncbi:hypothetical protein NLM27_07140 [Bradyrhizobium sp. CCGB12]|uniref:hypothetical protein n=1 Tax=Bradyrhizobium sp. CCGB12 TaxID=2949632 RepID=UPI0020B43A59|nr:hypothetical protein [Bradyrhizobium sp. CCGB12]MCP3388558.1 hypothetical protein [Bradyrhizobium sp. CCGB12]